MLSTRLIDEITSASCQQVLTACKGNLKGTNGQGVKADAIKDALIKGPEVRNCLEDLFDSHLSRKTSPRFENPKYRKNYF